MKWFLSSLLFLLPSFVFAGAGFAQDSVWFSKNPITEGETVSIYAALTNGETSSLHGVTYFRDNGKRIGTLPITLASGEARIVSISWTPEVGEHTIAVELASSTIQLAKTTETVTVTVNKKQTFDSITLPPKSNTAAVGYTDSAAIQNQIGSFSPAAENVLHPVFSTLDGLRKSGGDVLGAQIVSTNMKIKDLTKQKADLKASGAPDNHTLTLTQILYTILLYIYEALQMLLSKAGLFFPLVAALFFLFLWKLYRHFRKPSYKY